MTPGARVAAAIEILDQIGAGSAAEQALTAWARASRYAGSKDRAAVRDHVYDVLRARRSLGDGDGRSLLVQLALREGWDTDVIFSGDGHAPAPLSSDEKAPSSPLSPAAAHDIPDWLWPHWQESIGSDASATAIAQQGRAEVFLRVNQRRGSMDDAIKSLANDGVEVEKHPLVDGCLRVATNPRRVKAAKAYTDGLVELQDASSQWAIRQIGVNEGGTLLDYCAGGGGKALGFADQTNATVFAHDIAPQRMRDLPDRAARAGVQITRIATSELGQHAPYDVVFCDAPCSGAGTWRRTPDAKWRLDQSRLDKLVQSQREVLCNAEKLVKKNGILAYATCSVLDCENGAQISDFLGNFHNFSMIKECQRLPNADGDGFYLAVLQKK